MPDGNGAGIRLENQNLRVDHVHFNNDQVGILSGMTGGDVTVTDSLFTDGGSPSKYALMIGRSARFTVQDSTFSDVKGGQIATEANYSGIVDNTIGVGAGDADETSAYAVLATGGVLLMERNVITVGPLVTRSDAAIGVWDDSTATLRGNRMVNRTGKSIALLRNWSWRSPMLQDNLIGAGDSLTSNGGVWRHRLSDRYYLKKTQAHYLASQTKQLIKQLFGR